MAKRADVALVFIPYVDGPGGKRRPAAVVQRDEYNSKLTSTVFAAISSNLKNANEPTHHVLGPGGSAGRATGVLQKSRIRCDRLFTVEQNLITKTIGQLITRSIARVDDCLRAALGLPPQAQAVS